MVSTSSAVFTNRDTHQSGPGGALMPSRSQSIRTNERHAAMDAVSLCVMKAPRATSAHNDADGALRCGMSTGAMRMSAPFPADGWPQRNHALPDRRSARNARTADPRP